MEKIKRVRGMRDILPQEAELLREIEKTFIKFCELFGYREIKTPIVESKSLFERGIGSTTDIIMKEMYEFKDKKGRELALRPEGTASIVRAYIENQIFNSQKIARFFYSGPMFRYDRPQKGRYREFFQFGIEVFGGKSYYFDVEVLFILNLILNELNIKNSTFIINSLGCKNCKTEYVKNIKEKLIENISSFCEDCKVRIEKNPLRVLDCKNFSCKEQIKKLPIILNFLCNECKTHFDKLIEVIDYLKINYKIDPFLVRGLDYYTKTVFEVIINDENFAIAGGGRYDYLVKEMGGPDTPAVGFAAGIDRILSVFKKKIDKNGIYIILLGDKAKRIGIEIGKQLTAEDIMFEIDYDERKLGEHLRIANKLGKKWCIIIGENEIEKGILVLKNMETGEQFELNRDELIKKAKEIIKC